MVARLHGVQKVAGSNPATPTKFPPRSFLEYEVVRPKVTSDVTTFARSERIRSGVGLLLRRERTFETQAIDRLRLAGPAMVALAGRFAPSPSGPLHLGSLLAALGSYLQARAQGAQWYLRIDDLDTPRVQPGAERAILDALVHFGLVWDGAVLRQSSRREAYRRAIRWLKRHGHAFDCGCTRREAQDGAHGIEGPVYPGTCRNGLPDGREPRSVRFIVDSRVRTVNDQVQGVYTQRLDRDIGDFVIRRADGIAAYQLATILDDHEQGVSEVIRGADLLSSTPRQIALYDAFDWAPPAYGHLPILVDAGGEKLGKSTGALALESHAPGAQLYRCLVLLGQEPPPAFQTASVARVLAWATDNWSVECVPATAQITL